jgi:hypothetical protein
MPLEKSTFVCVPPYLKVSNLVHKVMKQAYKNIDLAVQCAYEECVSMKSIGFNIFGRGSTQCYKNICLPDLDHLKNFQLQWLDIGFSNVMD